MTISTRLIELPNGITLETAESGPADGPRLLLLHGFPELWRCWRQPMAHFAAAGWRVLAPNLRGYGRSTRPDGATAYRMHHLVEDIRLLIEQDSAGPVTLAGHDWGGAVAWALAIFHPYLLQRLVIVNAPHPAIFARELLQNRVQQAGSTYIKVFRSPGAEALLAADNFAKLTRMLTSQISTTRSLPTAELTHYRAAWSRPGALTAMLNYYRAMQWETADLQKLLNQATARPDSMQVQTPTLVIWGLQDKALLAGNLDGLADFVPNLRIHRLPQASHWILHEEPDTVTRLMQGFLQE